MEVKWQRDGTMGLGFSDTQGRIDALLTELKRGARQFGGLQPSRGKATPLIGDCPTFQRALQRARQAARSQAPVFITGETGTGKDLLASYLHDHSVRRNGPFVPINCASLSGEMAGSDLFGHKKGAFTGAVNDRVGAVARASHGTLFLDEFAELDGKEQARLLRFTQSGEYMRIGDELVLRSDARLICATNRFPSLEIKAGRLRSDLFYRLNTLPIHMPPLRDRREDILALAEHFLKVHTPRQDAEGRFDPAAAAWMLSYHWPGNVRQLSNSILQCVTLMNSPHIGRDDIEDAANSTAEDSYVTSRQQMEAAQSMVPEKSPVRALEDIISDAITRAIEENGGSIPKAAQVLQISPSTLYRRLEARKVGSA